MVLAISSYKDLEGLADDQDLLRLVWTLDERAYLAVDLGEVVASEIKAEAHDDLPFVNSYFVQDPYGNGIMGAAVASFFAQSKWDCDVTCGAGVNSLLHAIAGLTKGRPMYVIGDVYPDLPHWVEQSGGRCVSRYGGSSGDGHICKARAAGALLVLVERPSLAADGFSLVQLRDLCDGVGRFSAIVVVDESYANYYPPSFSAVNIVSELKNLVVIRGLSKAYSLGGLRLGFCVTPSWLTEQVRAVIPPLLASSLSLRIGRAVLGLGDITKLLRERIRTAKPQMMTLLEAGGITDAIPSCELLPYVFYRETDLKAQRQLADRGIVGKLQPFWSERDLAMANKYRLSVPLRPERMEHLKERIGVPNASYT
jgi:histidinol-phosphate/aromatic aminotransferase/cobyric acid decarboxylase-like protein